MKDENKARSGEDITADELIARLEKQMREKPQTGASQKADQDNRKLSNMAARDTNETYDDAIVADHSGDSELDIEALLKKYMPSDDGTDTQTADTDDDGTADETVAETVEADADYAEPADSVYEDDADIKIGESIMTPDDMVYEKFAAPEPAPVTTVDALDDEPDDGDAIIEPEPVSAAANSAGAPEKPVSTKHRYRVRRAKLPITSAAAAAEQNADATEFEVTTWGSHSDDTRVFEPALTGDIKTVKETVDDSAQNVKAAPAAADDETAETPINTAVDTDDGADSTKVFDKSAITGEQKKAPDAESGEVDDTDISLMLGLGLMDDEKTKTIGIDKVKSVEENIKREQTEKAKKPAFEFTERSQIKRIIDSYKYAFRATKVKLVIAILFSLMLLVFENISVLGIQFAGALDPAVYPVVYVMVDLQILLLCAAAAYEQILNGIALIFKGRPGPESLTSLMVLLAIAHSAVAAATATVPYEPTLYNFPVSLGIVLSLVFTYLNIKREIFSFNVVSVKRPKYVLEKLGTDESRLESEIFSDDGMTDETPDVLRISKANFVDGYFARSETPSSAKTLVALIIPIAVAFAAIFFVFDYLGGADISTSASTAYVAALFCLPISIFFTYSVPFYKANKAAFEMDSTIIGEVSLTEYSRASVISFDDKNVFPSYGVKIQNINFLNNGSIERVFYLATSVFSAVGGPLADVFGVATADIEKSTDVRITKSVTGCLEATVDGSIDVMFAKRSYLDENGIVSGADDWDSDSAYGDADVSVMYMLIDGVPCAKFYVKYLIDTDFEAILRQLSANGMCVGVKTFDPNIDEEMIGRKIKLKKYPLRILRYTSVDQLTQQNARINSGIISRANTKSLLQTVTLCDKVLGVRRTNFFIKILSMAIGLIIAALITASGTMADVASVYIGLYQLVWILPMMLTTRIFI